MLLFFVPTRSYCQPGNLDSILNIRSDQHISTSEYWESTVDVANYYIYHDIKKAEETIESVFLEFLEKDGSFDKCYHRHHLLQSWVNHGRNRLKDAIAHLSKAEAIVRKCGKRKDEIEIQINKASLLVSLKDTFARNYVLDYMTKIDTSGDRNEKIAWIQGKYYLGELDESRGFYRTALENYVEVYHSGILEEISKYRLGTIKGIARSATQMGDYKYAIEILNSLMNDKELFTYQKNNIRIAQAINYYKIDSLENAYNLTDEILASENISAQDKIEAGWIRVKINLANNVKAKVLSELDEILSLKEEVEDKKLLARINLLQAEVSSKYDPPQKVNKLLSNYFAKGYGSKEQDLKAEKLWLTSNISGEKGKKLNSYLQSLALRKEEKSSAELQEMMAMHKVNQKKAENKQLIQKLESEKQISAQRRLTILFLGFSVVLATMLWLMSRKKTQVQEQLNKLLESNRKSLINKNANLKAEKEELVFKNNELLKIKQSLEILSSNNTGLKTAKLEIKSNDKVHLVQISSILYFKAEMDGTRIFIKGGKSIWTDLPFKNYSQDYKRDGIVQIFRGLAININHIEWVNHATLKMDNGDELKIGRTYKQDILNILHKSKV